MFKKRYLPILIILLLIIGTVAYLGIEKYRTYAIERDRIYAVCRDKLLDSPFRGRDWKYGYIVFSSDGGFPPPITAVFDDGVNTLWCHVHRNGSEWEVDDISASTVAPHP